MKRILLITHGDLCHGLTSAMNIINGSSDGIDTISLTEKETIEDIEKSLDNGNLIEYIFNKYRDDFFVLFDNGVYDNEALNLYFQNYSGYIQGNESRKYGIMNETDGLLLILALISDKIEHSAANWTN